MSAIILGWDPDPRNDWNDATVRGRVAEAGRCFVPWRVNGAWNLSAGTDAWLFLQGPGGRGLIGHGVVVSEQQDAAQRAAAQQESGQQESGQQESGQAVAGQVAARIPGTVQDDAPVFVHLAVDALLPPGEHIAVAVLKAAVPGIEWEDVDAFGLGVEPADEAALRALWRDAGPPAGADPTQHPPGTYPQGAVTRAEVNRYERDPDARRACIALHGTSCAACGFSFELTYGDVGADLMPVHHLVPVSRLGSRYELDPLTDLVPLCGNCHAVAHRGGSTARTVAELRRIIAGAGFLRDSVVTAEQLESQRQARELLGPPEA
ncbi:MULTISPECIES: HNH endonuclease [unclassified Arthrobacter]|uniref:HNH endonuclease n=1 Tax=unclassified Arthrobacter TaxID=235627 RepID=UPI001CFFBFE3|nr:MULTISPECIES: HNH endonuclease [unclassified Arthrobacter]MCB5283744.1 hypothetical protein [Arthrobacter sp. ES1]WGZ80146.1 HNH endonuclease [Arthrobacter sp. EM1]